MHSHWFSFWLSLTQFLTWVNPLTPEDLSACRHVEGGLTPPVLSFLFLFFKLFKGRRRRRGRRGGRCRRNTGSTRLGSLEITRFRDYWCVFVFLKSTKHEEKHLETHWAFVDILKDAWSHVDLRILPLQPRVLPVFDWSSLSQEEEAE